MITPKEAYQKARPDIQKMTRLEEKIDDALVSGVKSGLEQIYINANIFPDIISRKEIMQKYQLGGWTVRYESDQKEGDYLTFTKTVHSNTEFWDYRR